MRNGKTITVYVYPEERELLTKAAEIAGLSDSAFFRSVTLEKARIILKENKGDSTDNGKYL